MMCGCDFCRLDSRRRRRDTLAGVPLAPVQALSAVRIEPQPKPDRMVRLSEGDRKGTWMQTFSGVSFYPLDPRAEEVRVVDVAHGLSMACRYAGQTRWFYPVAVHCVLVSLHVAPEFAREALFHDGSEAYIGDMIRPLKHTAEMYEFRKAEDLIQRAIFDAVGVVSTPNSHRAVKEIDDRILVDEIDQLMHTPRAYRERMADLEPLGITIPQMTPRQAEELFLARYHELFV